MGLRVAVASGNWSNPAIWNGGVLPTVGDTIASNGFTVTIDQNINVDLLTNTSVTAGSAVPLMTNYTVPSGIVTTSGEFNTSYRAWQLFDRNAGTSWFTPSSVLTGWVAYEFTSSKVITSYTLNTDGSNYSAKNWTFEAWDGTTWVVLDTVINNLGTVTRSFTNTTAYIKYRINISANNGGTAYTSTRDLYMYEANDYLSTTTAGGGFILNDGVTVTCTGTGIVVGSVTCLTYSGAGSVTINSDIYGVAATNTNAFLISGTGTVTINGTVNGDTSSNGANNTINVTAAATLNVNGKVNGYNGSRTDANAIRLGASGSVLNLIGDVETRGTLKTTVFLNTGTTLNMTGNAYCGFNQANGGRSISANNAIINITGNLYIANTTGANTGWSALEANNNCIINIVGTVSADPGSTAMTGGSNAVIIGGSASYYNHVGPVIGGFRHLAFQSTGASNINILTGPFISSPEGIQPIYVTRMHYRRTMGSYYEFRDNSTLGALPPSPPAPATRLVSPDTVVDAPIPANVRQGIVYASGSQTGTMIVPSPSNVANNVPVDNTLGTAVLDPNAIWAVPLTSINTLNSIGRRVKNAATVETTGAQIQTTLNNNE
jgi:hypothetical protein